MQTQPYSNISNSLMSGLWPHLSKCWPCHCAQSCLLNTLSKWPWPLISSCTKLLKNLLFLSVTKFLILTLKACHHLLFLPLHPPALRIFMLSQYFRHSKEGIAVPPGTRYWKHLLLKINSQLYHIFKSTSFNHGVKDSISYQRTVSNSKLGRKDFCESKASLWFPDLVCGIKTCLVKHSLSCSGKRWDTFYLVSVLHHAPRVILHFIIYRGCFFFFFFPWTISLYVLLYFK